MMIEYKTGDLLAEKADALVNTVNCVGAHGRRDRTAVQEGVAGKLSRLCCGVSQR